MINKNKIAITIGLVIGFILIGLWTWYLLTLPKLEVQLKYSPFEVNGTWECNEINFIITSNKNEDVECKIEYNNETYNLILSYHSTRGFSHKWAASIYAYGKAYDESYFINFDGYKFNENNFTLKIYSDNIFNGLLKTLTFNKTN